MTKNPCEKFSETADQVLYSASRNPGSLLQPVQPVQPAIQQPSQPTIQQPAQPAARKVEYLPDFDKITLITVNAYDNGAPKGRMPKREKERLTRERFGINLQFFDLAEPFTPNKEDAALNACCGVTRDVNGFDTWLNGYMAGKPVGTLSVEQTTRLQGVMREASTQVTVTPYPLLGLPVKYGNGMKYYFDAACMLFEEHDQTKLAIIMPGGRFLIDLHVVRNEPEGPKWRGRHDPNKLWLAKNASKTLTKKAVTRNRKKP